MFNKAGSPSKKFSTAVRQVEDWDIAIQSNPIWYYNDLLRIASDLPLFESRRSFDRGFKLASSQEIESLWRAFGGEEGPVFRYTIVMGRWSRLNKNDKNRIIQRNKKNSATLRVMTYEQTIRSSNLRMERFDCFNAESNESDALDIDFKFGKE